MALFILMSLSKRAALDFVSNFSKTGLNMELVNNFKKNFIDNIWVAIGRLTML